MATTGKFNILLMSCRLSAERQTCSEELLFDGMAKMLDLAKRHQVSDPQKVLIEPIDELLS
jgi:hypothetical protein